MKYNLLLLLSFFLFYFSSLQAQEIDTTMWVTNGNVNAVMRYGNTIYVGGSFTQVGPNTGSWASVNTTSGSVTSSPLLKINNSVIVSVSDGKGGWYIGGSFTYVQGVSRNRLAHILSDGTLDQEWDPNADYDVHSLAISGNVIYVGGGFTRMSGQDRSRIAAIDATTGQVTDWNPVSYGTVYTLAVAGNVVYAGGFFSTIGGQTRNNLAAIDVTTGQVTAWNPAPEHSWGACSIKALAIAGNLIYIGGSFTSIGGKSKSNLAAIDVITGETTDWSPAAANKIINTLAVAENVVYIGGEFKEVDNQSRNHLAAINATTGQLTAWNPNANFWVETIAVAGNIVYAGGFFSTISGQSRNRIAAIDATTGQLTAWNPNANSWVETIAVSNNVVYIGGGFSSIGSQARKHIAAINATTGQLTAWNPDFIANSERSVINALAFAGNAIYAGGSFYKVGSQIRNNAVAFNATTGQVTAWNPNVTGTINTLTVIENKIVYIGGNFYEVGGQSRSSLAAIDATTGQVTAWNPNVTGIINTLTVMGNTMYVGGEFASIGGQARNNLAAMDAQTGKVTAWSPNTNSKVLAIATSNNTIYIGGNFYEVGGQSRSKLAAIDATTGQITTWNPNVAGTVNTLATVNALAVAGNTMYVGGEFASIGGQARNNLAAIDAQTGKVTAWSPNMNNSVYTLTFSGNVLYAGGNFTSSYNSKCAYLAAFGKPVLQPNYVQGSIYQDNNGDCVRNNLEKGLANITVVAQPGNYFASTDSLGKYSLALDTGTYTIEQIIPVYKSKLIKQTCPISPSTHTVRFTSSNETLSGKDLANQISIQPYLYVSISSTRRRRCFASSTTVSYNNIGTAPATGVKVHVQLPEYVVLKSANLPFTQSIDKSYVFDIGTLTADTYGMILIQDSVICGNPDIRNLTQCTKVWITPAKAPEPSPNWDKSDITLKANCLDNGRVRLAIYNTGEGHMADSSTYRILLDAQLAFSSNLKLSKGDSLILQVPANGRTVRLETDQRPNHSTKQLSNITIEACGSNINGTVSKGFVSQLPQDDVEPEVTIECLPIIDSFDPNDKLVLPQGVTSQHYTPTNIALNYTVRFQNTGTDYAYKVAVVDTLSEHLDVSTLTMGAVSHPYKLNVSGKGKPVLTFTFDNINLPDSTHDKLGSNGSIQFSIRPKKNLPIKTRIENYADIFFDYNEPVRTNIAFNTIYDIPPVVVESVRLDQSIIEGTPTGIESSLASLIKIYPNPTSGIVTIELTLNLGTQIQLSVYDALGNTIVQNSLSKGIEKTTVDLSNHTGGLYLIKLQTPTGLIVYRVLKK